MSCLQRRAGCIQSFEPSGLHRQNEEPIKRYGGTTASTAPWPEEKARRRDTAEDTSALGVLRVLHRWWLSHMPWMDHRHSQTMLRRSINIDHLTSLSTRSFDYLQSPKWINIVLCQMDLAESQGPCTLSCPMTN